MTDQVASKERMTREEAGIECPIARMVRIKREGRSNCKPRRTTRRDENGSVRWSDDQYFNEK